MVNEFKDNRKVYIVAAVVVAIVALIAFLIYMLVPKVNEYVIDGFQWERKIAIEGLRTFNESGWYLPSEARLDYTRREIKTYEKVFSHYETKYRNVYDENGNSEQEYYQEAVYTNEPVYATKFYYEIDRWVEVRSVYTAGSDKDPYWGDVVLGELERKGLTTEKYSVVARRLDDKKAEQKVLSVNFEDWNSMNIDRIVNLKVALTGAAELVLENA